MRKILYNQHRFKDKELIYNLYGTFLKTEGAERDIYDVVKWSRSHYEANKFFPSPETLRENFKTFQFVEEQFVDDIEELVYVKEKSKVYREKYRDDILIKLVNEKTLPAEKRLELIDEMTKLEMQVFDLKETVSDVSELDIKEMYDKRKNKGSGLKTNIDEIDALTGGMLSGKIMVVLAGPKSGKSMFALNMCYINLKIPDNNSLFISLEIPRDELMYKMLVRHSYDERRDLPFMKTIKGKLDPVEEQTLVDLKKSFDTQMQSKLYILASNDLRGDSILTIKQQIVDIIQDKKIKTIYLDYLQLMKFGYTGKGNIYEYLNEIVGMFRYIAVAYDVRIVLLSQATKEGIKRGQRTQGHFEATDASESNALLRDSYYLLTLYLDDGLKTASNIKNQFLYHRDGECYEEPKITNIIPSKYIIGNINITPNQFVAVDPNKTVLDENGDVRISLSLDEMFEK